MDELFAVHRLNENGLKKTAVLAHAFDLCLTTLSTICPAGREFSLVKTKLEEASFFAKKAIALQPENQLEPRDPASVVAHKG